MSLRNTGISSGTSNKVAKSIIKNGLSNLSFLDIIKIPQVVLILFSSSRKVNTFMRKSVCLSCIATCGFFSGVQVGLQGLGAQRRQRQLPGTSPARNNPRHGLPPRVRVGGSVLRGDVHDVGEIVRFGGLVAGQGLKGLQPSLDSHPPCLSPEVEGPPVGRGGTHPLHMGDEGEVHNGQKGQEPRTLTHTQLLIHFIQTIFKPLPGVAPEGRPEDQITPQAEQKTLQLH
mmetsp:Transcript_11152/g.15375  ORF Transcript_11152/g.15375 Transcript_11152/m.15375 type:complete len:229 (+) Transcript_11152:757-1443(+)